jgi:hypothetical protein
MPKPSRRIAPRRAAPDDSEFDADDSAAEGVRLIKAFVRIADPARRAWLIEQAETMAAR